VEENKMTNTIYLSRLDRKDIPSRLREHYERWLEAIFTTEHPGWFSKHVSIEFEFNGHTYHIDQEDFRKYAKETNREKDIFIHDALVEVVIDNIIRDDVLTIGVRKSSILVKGSLD
jgi:hypothetical protein